MMDESGTWAGVDAATIDRPDEIIVAAIPRRQEITHLEGRFDYIGTCLSQGRLYVVLRVPHQHDRLMLQLQYVTIPLGQVPRVHLPEENYAKRTTTPGVGVGA